MKTSDDLAMRQESVDYMRQFVGTRFRHQGRNPSTGLDCAGFGRIFGIWWGKNPPDRRRYGRDPDGSFHGEICKTFGQPLLEGLGCHRIAQQADVVLMEFSPDQPRHCGIITERNGYTCLLHADDPFGVVEHRLSDEWRARIVAVWRPAA